MINSITLNLILDSKHKHSTKCAQAGCMSGHMNELQKEPRVSVEQVGPDTQLLPAMHFPDLSLLEDVIVDYEK